MEFREILARRRMHRAFLTDRIPDEQIERIVGVIRRAPSGGFSQGGSIVAVTDDARRAAIARAFGDEHYSRGGRNFIADAPVHLVISANESLYHARGLASAFVGHPDQKRIFDKLLGLPEEVVPIGLALIGKPGDDPPIGSRLRERRRPQEQLVHRQQW